MTGAAAQYELLVLDFDGVVLDTETSALAAWREVFLDHGCTVDESLWREVSGRHDARERLLDDLVVRGTTVDRTRALRRWLERQTALAEALPLAPAVEDVLDRARSRGMRLAVAPSATGDWVVPHLRRLGVLERFEQVVTGDGRAAKPDPAVYRAVLTACGVRADRAISVEDSPPGVEAARAAGIDCVGLAGTARAADALREATWVIDSLDRLLLDGSERVVEDPLLCGC